MQLLPSATNCEFDDAIRVSVIVEKDVGQCISTHEIADLIDRDVQRGVVVDRVDVGAEADESRLPRLHRRSENDFEQHDGAKQRFSKGQRN